MFMGGLTAAVATIAAPPAVVLESWALSPSAIRAWVETAMPGSELVYARDYRMGAKTPAGEFVRRLRRAGVVTMVQRGRPGEAKAYVVQRLPAAVMRTAKAKQPKLNGDMARVLRILRRCARDGKVCPPNRELGKAAGVKNASYQLQRLVEAKFITSRVVDVVRGTRIVTIVESGEATATPERQG